MKTVMAVLTSFVAGMVLSSSPLSALRELGNYLEHKRRVVWSLIFRASSFVFIMAAILFSATEVALQLQVQSYLIWNSILTLSASLLGAAVICALIGKWLMPKASLAHSSEVVELVEQFVAKLFEGVAAPSKHEPEPHSRPGPDRSEVADYGQPEYTTH